MQQDYEKTESDFLACCITDPGIIDRAVQQGLTPNHLAHVHHKAQFAMLCDMRLRGLDPSVPEVLLAEAGRDRGRLAAMGGLPALLAHHTGTTLHASTLIESLLEAHARRSVWKLFHHGAETLAAGAIDLGELRELSDKAQAVLAGQSAVQRSLGDIGNEAIRDAEEQIAGKPSSKTLVTTGLHNFDRWATPIGQEEIVVVGGRTSAGKSSLMLQIAGHNLAAGLRVAVFSLETSDSVVLKQMVGQRASVNIRDLASEMPAKQKEYMDKLRFAKESKNLMIFDRDTRLDAIQARCRLLAATFKPQLVVVDYLNIIGTDGDSYERVSRISNAMIELRKTLNCTLMVGAQLNRSSEKEEREPNRTDYRDSGSVEQDASRLLAIWRKPGQALDLNYYDCSLLQLKHRSGPLAKVDCRFHARTTTFKEVGEHA